MRVSQGEGCQVSESHCSRTPPAAVAEVRKGAVALPSLEPSGRGAEGGGEEAGFVLAEAVEPEVDGVAGDLGREGGLGAGVGGGAVGGGGDRGVGRIGVVVGVVGVNEG